MKLKTRTQTDVPVDLLNRMRKHVVYAKMKGDFKASLFGAMCEAMKMWCEREDARYGKPPETVNENDLRR